VYFRNVDDSRQCWSLSASAIILIFFETYLATFTPHHNTSDGILHPIDFDFRAATST
jgi:hypothetical protein